MRISDTVGYLLNFAFPPRCISCAEVLAIDYAPPLCSDCTGGLCYAGSADVRDYSLYAYNSVTRRIIHACKYGGRPAYGRFLGERMAAHYHDILPRGLAVDAVIPVPLHASKQRERGFNQAEVLARALCERLSLPLASDVLTRTRATDRQAFLDIHERRVNVDGAFAVRDTADVRGKSFLLLDDIFTTGSTIRSCANALLDAGAEQVSSYTAARANDPADHSENANELFTSHNNTNLSKNANINDNLFR